MYELIVTQPFGQRAVGYHIKDEAEIKAVLAGPNARNVQRIFATEKPVEAKAEEPVKAEDPAPAPKPAPIKAEAASEPSGLNTIKP